MSLLSNISDNGDNNKKTKNLKIPGGNIGKNGWKYSRWEFSGWNFLGGSFPGTVLNM